MHRCMYTQVTIVTFKENLFSHIHLCMHGKIWKRNTAGDGVEIHHDCPLGLREPLLQVPVTWPFTDYTNEIKRAQNKMSN